MLLAAIIAVPIIMVLLALPTIMAAFITAITAMPIIMAVFTIAIIAVSLAVPIAGIKPVIIIGVANRVILPAADGFDKEALGLQLGASF